MQSEVTRYDLDLFGWKSDANKSWSQASIVCYLNNDIVAYIKFYKPGHVPQSSYVNPTGSDNYMQLGFELSMLEPVLAMLRYEKPVYVGIYTSGMGGWVCTNPEPVGEQEGV